MRSPKATLALMARLVLGGAFVFYGWHKIAHPEEFLKALRGYDVFPVSPPEVMNCVAVILPWVEVICGALLLLGAWLRSASALVFALTAVFTVAVTWRALTESEASGVTLCAVEFDCGCGQGPVWFCVKLAENAVLIGLALILARGRQGAR